MVRKKAISENSRCLLQYESLVKTGSIESNRAQVSILKCLDDILNVLDLIPAEKNTI